ncbi:MAG: DUF4123 domain-containing protein [Telluria sp.]
MLIDSFAEATFAGAGRKERDSSLGFFLLIDGAFVPGLQKKVESNRKAILFESLPGCSDEARDVSPFLVRFEPGDKAEDSLMRRCDRWPMVSLIETPETLNELSERLAAWCVVDADGQSFNFRFADTRRLPAIYLALHPHQRAQFAGPAVHWSYVARDGHWRELELDSPGAEIAVFPNLDEAQFARLVDDSRGDEMLTLLRGRGYEVYRRPSRSHALLAMALHAATAARLNDDELIGWCAWFWRNDQLGDHSMARSMLDTWRTPSI